MEKLPLVVCAFALSILALTIYAGSLHLRGKIRGQMIQRDAEILHSVALMLQISGEEGNRLGGKIESLADQLNIMLEISNIEGVIAARLFDPQGAFVLSFPKYVSPTSLPAAKLSALRQLKPTSHFVAHGSLSLMVASDLRAAQQASQSVPLMEVNIPLHRKQPSELVGVVQFILDGQSMAEGFASLDARLLRQGILAFAVAGTLLLLAILWALHRLQKANRALREQTAELKSANEELALAAKTSALGAVTAHLLHGLNNPLSGLEESIANKDSEEGDTNEWRLNLLQTTRRMKSMVEGVVQLLSEEQDQESYLLSCRELMALLQQRVTPVAHEAGVHLIAEIQGDAMLTNRETHLVLLILENLLENAIQSTPQGKEVRLHTQADQTQVVCEVSDQGPGFPEHLLPSLFKPCRSTKQEGSGIGLAICKQLTQHLQGQLTLERKEGFGCVFRLEFAPPAEAAAAIDRDQAALGS